MTGENADEDRTEEKKKKEKENGDREMPTKGHTSVSGRRNYTRILFAMPIGALPPMPSLYATGVGHRLHKVQVRLAAILDRVAQ